MSTEAMLSVIAILRAYVTADAEALTVLIKDAPETGYSDLLAFCSLMLDNGSERPVVYLDTLARNVYAMHVEDLARRN